MLSASKSSRTCSRPSSIETAWILLRSSHTTFVKETQDFAVALVTPDGETFAYPYGAGATPIMGVPMHAGTKAVADWAPGDVLITNDPYSTGGMVMHLERHLFVSTNFCWWRIAVLRLVLHSLHGRRWLCPWQHRHAEQ